MLIFFIVLGFYNLCIPTLLRLILTPINAWGSAQWLYRKKTFQKIWDLLMVFSWAHLTVFYLPSFTTAQKTTRVITWNVLCTSQLTVICFGTGSEILVTCQAVHSYSLLAREVWKHASKIVHSSKIWSGSLIYFNSFILNELTPFISVLMGVLPVCWPPDGGITNAGTLLVKPPSTELKNMLRCVIEVICLRHHVV